VEEQKEDLNEASLSQIRNGTSPQGANQTGFLSGKELDLCFANRMRENIDWFEANEARLRREHPEWDRKFLTIASRTPSKILAVSEDRDVALDTALSSPELLAQSVQEGIPLGYLMNAVYLGVDWDD